MRPLYVSGENGKVSMLPADGAGEAGVREPASVVGESVGGVDEAVDRGDAVGGIIGDEKIAEHESAPGGEDAVDAAEEVGLAGCVEVVDGQHRDDEVERTGRQPIFEALPEQPGTVGVKGPRGGREHRLAGVQADKLGVGKGADGGAPLSSPARCSRPLSWPTSWSARMLVSTRR